MNVTGSYDFIRELVYKQLQVPVYTETSYANSNVALPCIIFSRTDTNSPFAYMGISPQSVYIDTVKFSIQGKTIEKVEDIRDFLLSLLDGYDGQITLDSETNVFTIETGIYTRDINFKVIYKQ
jgi:hypothetical protein